MGLDLRELRKPLDDVTFPNGAKHQPVPFGPTEYQLWRDAQKETDQKKVGRMVLQIIRACYPTVTDDDILDCDGDMLLAVAAYAGGKIEQVRHALKNAAAVASQPETPPSPPADPAAATVPSSPKTNGATSSRKSRGRSAKSGGASTTVSPTASPISSGSRSTVSTTPNASTRFAESSTTSTAPA
jgi:hypothetical protein